MAKIELLLQAFGAGVHATALKELLSIPGLTRFVASVAFVREGGVDAIAPELKSNHKACAFFVGIRNGITSVQSVRRLLELRVKVFAVDTASRSTLFHPKMFLSVGPGKGIAVIGSANVTFSGLHNNVEASTVIHLDPADGDDAKFLKASLDSIDELPARFPDHVFQIKTKAAANVLFDQGRLADEEMIVATPPHSSIRKGERDKLRPIKLPRHFSPKHGKRIRASLKAQVTAAAATKPPGPTPNGDSQSADFVLIWESKALTERDLNIPTGAGTNATGSMLWKKGAAEDIDQRHFFRDEVLRKSLGNRTQNSPTTGELKPISPSSSKVLITEPTG